MGGATLGDGSVYGSLLLSRRKITTSRFRRELGERNRLSTLLKNYSLRFLLLVLPLYLLQFTVSICLFLLLRDFAMVSCYLRAATWHRKHLNTTLAKRRRIQTRRKRSDWYFFRRLYFGFVPLDLVLRSGFPNLTS
jgi:hypothetical protein